MNYFRTKDLNVKEIATFSLINFAFLKCLSTKTISMYNFKYSVYHCIYLTG